MILKALVAFLSGVSLGLAAGLATGNNTVTGLVAFGVSLVVYIILEVRG